MPPKDRHKPIPLERWIRGRVDVHFRDGHVAHLQVSLHSAHSIRLQADDAEGGESIDGLESHEGWIAARSQEIILTEWTPDADYGWKDTSPDDRDRLHRLGMRHGILNALADLWGNRGDKPAYSIAAVSALYGVAVHENVTRKQWDDLAEITQGKDGAELVASAWKTAFPHDVNDDLVDDTAVPEPGQPTTDPDAAGRTRPSESPPTDDDVGGEASQGLSG